MPYYWRVATRDGLYVGYGALNATGENPLGDGPDPKTQRVVRYKRGDLERFAAPSRDQAEAACEGAGWVLLNQEPERGDG